jgi:DNA-binding LytR/AlgR family response regulator
MNGRPAASSRMWSRGARTSTSSGKRLRAESVRLIERVRPDLALLDLQMPDGGGLDVVRRLPVERLPLVAFVTAFDDLAIEAFELDAIDYLLKPAHLERVESTLARARSRLARSAAAAPARAERQPYLDRIPVKRRDDIVLVPVRQVACVVAEGELLHLTTTANERHTIAYRLHALEARLDPRRFIRLGRGTLANLESILRITPMPGGTYAATLANGQELAVSRLQSRVLRDSLLTLAAPARRRAF